MADFDVLAIHHLHQMRTRRNQFVLVPQVPPITSYRKIYVWGGGKLNRI